MPWKARSIVGMRKDLVMRVLAKEVPVRLFASSSARPPRPGVPLLGGNSSRECLSKFHAYEGSCARDLGEHQRPVAPFFIDASHPFLMLCIIRRSLRSVAMTNRHGLLLVRHRLSPGPDREGVPLPRGVAPHPAPAGARSRPLRVDSPPRRPAATRHHPARLHGVGRF